MMACLRISFKISSADRFFVSDLVDDFGVEVGCVAGAVALDFDGCEAEAAADLAAGVAAGLAAGAAAGSAGTAACCVSSCGVVVSSATAACSSAGGSATAAVSATAVVSATAISSPCGEPLLSNKPFNVGARRMMAPTTRAARAVHINGFFAFCHPLASPSVAAAAEAEADSFMRRMAFEALLSGRKRVSQTA